ncbi:hypothetical protein ACFV4I_14825 [Nocardiopsis alba]|uniref:hypothetical protein n=1 Tax=Nocardiopsis alba TaxID=53437 RepID=UPI0036636425
MTETTSPPPHNASCENAEQANCHCHCRGAGHQKNLLIRAARCPDSGEYESLRGSLQEVLGGFHRDARDVSTRTRPARNVPTQAEIPTLALNKKKGATWLETLLVDEALHGAFLKLAAASLRSSAQTRESQEKFVIKATSDAIPIVESKVTLKSVTEAHVWCSIVSEFLSQFSGDEADSPAPEIFSSICYPRKSRGGRPSSLKDVRDLGLQHIAGTFRTTRDLPEATKIDYMRLVGAATCPDLWRHASAVRYCLSPFVSDESWPPRGTTKLAVPSNFNELESRWKKRGHW